MHIKFTIWAVNFGLAYAIYARPIEDTDFSLKFGSQNRKLKDNIRQNSILFEDNRVDHGTFFDSEGFHGWSQENNLASLTSDCAKAIRKIPAQHQYTAGTIASHESCTIKVGGTGEDIPGDNMEEWALDMLLILARDPYGQIYQSEISGSYYGSYYGKVLCMGTRERRCESMRH